MTDNVVMFLTNFSKLCLLLQTFCVLFYKEYYYITLRVSYQQLVISYVMATYN